MATGVVTTTRVTHATPAATFAHSAERNWEDDVAIAKTGAHGCTDIARQMVESPYGTGPDVLLGGGRGNFMPASQVDPEYRSEEHTSELQSLMRISYAVFCLKKKKKNNTNKK